MAKNTHLIKTEHGSYHVKVWWDKNDKVYLVQGVSLPEAVTFGRTLAEAKRMAKDILELYCDCEIREGKLIIDDVGRAIGKLPKERVIAVPQ